ncbi:hypothetical protein ARMGADRAFT_1035681 [Armillaria gallica]|uniref:Uncharacterized protein n=1 Tax=Armillaria gallica TaxID=47427 RepID=A0A2H3DFI0_ARMGA|nr:hypothetical protein ARMGADRAFT_1035681 [Armillaria gallica]
MTPTSKVALRPMLKVQLGVRNQQKLSANIKNEGDHLRWRAIPLTRNVRHWHWASGKPRSDFEPRSTRAMTGEYTTCKKRAASDILRPEDKLWNTRLQHDPRDFLTFEIFKLLEFKCLFWTSVVPN